MPFPQPPPTGYYDDPGYYCLGVYKVEIRSESVQGLVREAEERYVEEGDPGLLGCMNQEAMASTRAVMAARSPWSSHLRSQAMWRLLQRPHTLKTGFSSILV